MCRKDSANGPPAKRRVLIVDDHPLVRRGLRALIDNEADLIVCAEVAVHRSGLAAIASSEPDLVITNLSLNKGDGLSLIRDVRARYADLPIMVLTLYDHRFADCAIRAGASGFVNKQEMNETLLRAIRRVLTGEILVSSNVGVDIS